jgi:hypothetical protein
MNTEWVESVCLTRGTLMLLEQVESVYLMKNTLTQVLEAVRIYASHLFFSHSLSRWKEISPSLTLYRPPSCKLYLPPSYKLYPPPS